MAPILAKASGVIPQVIDDENLRTVLTSLNALQPVPDDAPVVSSDQPLPSGILELCTILEPWHKEWRFEEQVCIDIFCIVLKYDDVLRAGHYLFFPLRIFRIPKNLKFNSNT